MTNAKLPGLEFTNVSRDYIGPPPVSALRGITLRIDQGEFVALVGASGSGKTTLLNIGSGLDRGYTGSVKIVGQEVSGMTRTELSEFRRRRLGFVFQSYNLFPALTAVENVEFTSIVRGDSRSAARIAAIRALGDVGLADKIDAHPRHLSGGQQQRVAVARAIASRPDIIFADEPTANLDSKTGEGLISLFKQLNRELGLTFVFSTHDRELIAQVDREIRIRDGQLLT